MRNALLVLALSVWVPGLAAADSVSGECQREGTTLKWVDGIAFEAARDEKGWVTTRIFFTTQPIDRKQLAQCPDCNDDLPLNDFLSTRKDWFNAQIKAGKGGWLSASYVGGEMDLLAVNDIMYFAPDGVQTGLAAGNERLTFEVNDGKRMTGTLSFAEGDYFGATCAGKFDLTVGWPQP